MVGFPMMMSDNLDISDAGVGVTMLTIPGMVVAAHAQSRLVRVQANDPDRPVTAPPPLAKHLNAPESEELQQLDLLRDRLLATLPAVEAKYPQVATEIRQADAEASVQLRQQGEALATLEQIQFASSPETQAARAEIRARMRKGVEEYHQLLAEAVLLLARTDAHVHVDAPLSRARDVVLTYSEGLRVSEGLEDAPR